MNERVLTFNIDILTNLVCEYKIAGVGENKIAGLELVIADLKKELDNRRKPVKKPLKSLKKRPTKLVKKA